MVSNRHFTEYAALKNAVESAGFYTTYMPFCDDDDNELDKHRLVCAGERFCGGITGNSFWIARCGQAWFLGTWGGHIYQIPDTYEVTDVCVAWLQRNPGKTVFDVDDFIKTQYELVRITDQQFELALGR